MGRGGGERPRSVLKRQREWLIMERKKEVISSKRERTNKTKNKDANQFRERLEESSRDGRQKSEMDYSLYKRLWWAEQKCLSRN